MNWKRPDGIVHCDCPPSVKRYNGECGVLREARIAQQPDGWKILQEEYQVLLREAAANPQRWRKA